MKIELSPKIYSLFFDIDGKEIKAQYRSARGGRAASKSWGFADMALLRVLQGARLAICRELKDSITDSIHQLLKDRIIFHDLSNRFVITENDLQCAGGGSICYKHLHNNVTDIKGLEGSDICWIFEAENLKKESYDILEPTIIRKKDAEIWFDYNTRMETDFVYQFTVVNKPANMLSVLVNYTDNPWCPQKTIELAERDKEENYKLYLNKWLGEPMTLGLFFQMFGKHNAETPFIIPEQDDSARIIGALDHGIAHDTSFSLYYLSPDGFIHCIFSYDQNGGTTKSHAEAICEAIEGSRFSRYMYPSEIYYDYAMDTKHALNEQNYRSDLDEYIEVFASRPGGKDVAFIPANKRKVDGCHSMQLVFHIGDGVPIFRYFDSLNDKTVESIKGVETDKVNTEQYMKMDGDDGADKTRYGVMGALTKMQTLNLAAKKNEKAAKAWKKPEPLTKQFGLS
jgi:PBSX family phage terminase large subunit